MKIPCQAFADFSRTSLCSGYLDTDKKIESQFYNLLDSNGNVVNINENQSLTQGKVLVQNSCKGFVFYNIGKDHCIQSITNRNGTLEFNTKLVQLTQTQKDYHNLFMYKMGHRSFLFEYHPTSEKDIHTKPRDGYCEIFKHYCMSNNIYNDDIETALANADDNALFELKSLLYLDNEHLKNLTTPENILTLINLGAEKINYFKECFKNNHVRNWLVKNNNIADFLKLSLESMGTVGGLINNFTNLHGQEQELMAEFLTLDIKGLYTFSL